MKKMNVIGALTAVSITTTTILSNSPVLYAQEKNLEKSNLKTEVKAVENKNEALSGDCGATENDNVKWELKQNNQDDNNPTYTLIISGEGTMANWNYLSGGIGSAVTDSPWFSYASKITDITIEDGVIIGERAFQGLSSIETFEFPSGITEIPKYAFADCTSLKNIIIPETVTSIGEGAFRACAMNEITIPSSVTTYGIYIFRGCHNLHTVNLPENMKELPNGIFSECPQLKSVTLPNLTIIGDNSFYKSGLEKIELSASVNTIGNRAFSECNQLEEIDLSNTKITSISDSLFQNSVNLKQVYLPETITSIDYAAFMGTGLKSIHLPSSVDTLDTQIVNKCNELVAISLYTDPFRPKEGENAGSNGDYYERIKGNCLKGIGDNSTIYFIGDELPLAFTGSFLTNRIDMNKSSIALTRGGEFIKGTSFAAGQFSKPIKSGFVFKGWYENEDCIGNSVNAPIAGNTYYASWEKSNFEVTNKFDFGTLPYGSLKSENITIESGAENDIFISAISSNEEVFTAKVDENDKNKVVVTPNKDLTVGTYNEQIVVTTKDGANHIVEVSLAVEKAEPAYEIPSDLTATYGEKLSDITIPAADNGTFTWNNPNEEVGNVGSKSFKATFTPKDTNNYKTVELEIPVTVTKAVPSYEIPSNLSAVEGQTLADVVLPNGFTWQDVTTTPVGSYGINSFFVTFTPEDTTNYEVVKNIPVQIVVNPKMETINTMPEIIANDVTLTVGDEFDPLANVTAKDAEDGEIALTKENIVSNDVDTSKAGTYHVTYKVTDSQGASTEITITVTVEDKGTEKPDVPTTPEKPSDPDISDKPADTNTTEKTDDSKTPVKANTSTEESKAPETGKESNMMLYGWGLLLSALGISGIVFAKRRRSR